MKLQYHLLQQIDFQTLRCPVQKCCWTQNDSLFKASNQIS